MDVFVLVWFVEDSFRDLISINRVFVVVVSVILYLQFFGNWVFFEVLRLVQ